MITAEKAEKGPNGTEMSKWYMGFKKIWKQMSQLIE